MTKTAKFTALILLFNVFSVQPLLASEQLPEFNARYGIEKYGVKLAVSKYRLSHTESGYKFELDTELYGFAGLFSDESVSAVSVIRNIDNRLLLTSHRYTQAGSKKNRNEDITIEWNTDKNSLQGTISGTVRGKKIKLETDSEVWEALSFQIPLMIEAEKGRKEYPYNAILKGKLNTYNFTLSAVENVSYAGRKYTSLHVVRTDPEKDRKLHIWLMPELHNIPFKVENYRDGKKHSSMQLESVQFDDAAPITDSASDDEF